MNITQVTYSRTLNLGNFNSARVEAVAEVNQGEDPKVVLAELSEWVKAEIVKQAKRPNGS